MKFSMKDDSNFEIEFFKDTLKIENDNNEFHYANRKQMKQLKILLTYEIEERKEIGVLFKGFEWVNGCIYVVYTGPNKCMADIFLDMQLVVEPLVYVIVETPEGNFGKDIDGTFNEPAR